MHGTCAQISTEDLQNPDFIELPITDATPVDVTVTVTVSTTTGTLVGQRTRSLTPEKFWPNGEGGPGPGDWVTAVVVTKGSIQPGKYQSGQ